MIKRAKIESDNLMGPYRQCAHIQYSALYFAISSDFLLVKQDTSPCTCFAVMQMAPDAVKECAMNWSIGYRINVSQTITSFSVVAHNWCLGDVHSPLAWYTCQFSAKKFQPWGLPIFVRLRKIKPIIRYPAQLFLAFFFSKICEKILTMFKKLNTFCRDQHLS